MSMIARVVALALACSFLILAPQAGRSNPQVQASVPDGRAIPKPRGLESAWTVRAILDELLKDNQKLEPLLAQMNPQEWFAKKGASEVYIQQWQTARTQLKEVIATSRLLSQKPENLSLALDDYFRLEALEVTSRSLLEAVSRYGDRFTADQLNGLIARNFSRRERFRDYLRDLTASSEQTFKLADEEAQRCRGIISKEPVKRARNK
jgi:hypothetical protein